MTFEDIIAEILSDWAPKYMATIKGDAKKIPTSSGEGIASFKYAIVKDPKIQSVLIAFNTYLRFYDMRKVQYDRVPNIDALKDFVSKKGTARFAPRFKAKYGYIPKDNTTFINKLAWGIGISMYKRGRWLAKRKKFYNKNTGTSINQLYRQLTDALSEYTAKNLTQLPNS
jgi:hypothetical protein